MVIWLTFTLLNLLQPGIADTKVVGDFMFDYSLYFSNDFIIIFAYGLNRLLEYGYFIRRHHAVVSASISEGYALIETEEGMTAPQAGLPQLNTGRSVFDHHVDIIQPGGKLIRQGFNRLGYQFLKSLLIHYSE